MFQKKTLYDIFKLRIILCFIVPAILAAVIIFLNHRLNIRQYYKMYNEFYINHTDEVFNNMEDEINSIARMDYWLKNEDVKRVFESDGELTDAQIGTAIQHMRRMRDDFEIIDSILIINRKVNRVVATNGKASADKYFNDIYKYKEYNASYFESLRYPVDTTIKLPPTSVEGNDMPERYVLPVVKMAAHSENPNSLFVFNISLEKLMKTHETSKYTDNTSFWFVNKKDKKLYFAGGSYITIDDKILDKIKAEKQMQNYVDDNGKKYCILTKTVSPSLMDYAYFVFIPIKDVDKAVSEVTFKIIILSIIIYLFFVLVVLLIATDVGKSIADLIKPLNFTEQVKMSEIFKVTDKISKEFSKILEENSSMNMEIKDMIGDVKEKMITDVINNKNSRAKMSLYRYDNFLPVVFYIIPTSQTDENVIDAIEERLYSLIHNYFHGKYETYDIKNMNGEFHFVLNVTQGINKTVLNSEIKKLSEVVLNNEIGVQLIYGMGDICNSFENLRDEYIKLIGNISSKEEKNYNGKYMYRVSESNSIINSILAGDYNKTIACIDRILITNVVNDVQENDMTALYQNIINTIVTALKMKRIDVDSLINDDKYFSISGKTETEISQFILDLLGKIDKCSEKTSGKRLLDDVEKYINDNYSDYALSLEEIAKKFNVDAKNLSKQFKKYTNVTFHKYVTEIRIEAAKRLLITTDLSIEQIYVKVGYVSRTTFMRAFNSIENITPSEYRRKARE